MKKILMAVVIAMVMFSGCTKDESVKEPSQIVRETRDDILGKWENDDGEIYNFMSAYAFDGILVVDGNSTQVEGDYNLVTTDGSDTTLTINTPQIRVTYYIEVGDDTITLSDTETREAVSTLRYIGS